MSVPLFEFASIAVALPVLKPYTWRIPAELLTLLEPGHGVIVPFGPRLVSGFVLERLEAPGMDLARIKPIQRLLAPEPFFEPAMLAFFRWIASYYHHPLGEVIRTALPAGVLAESQLTLELTARARAMLKGRAHLEPSLSADAVTLLAAIPPRAGLRFGRLQEKPPVEGAAGLVRLLVRQELLTLSQRLEDATVRPSTLTRYRIGLPADLKALRGETRRAVLEILHELGEAELSELKDALHERGRKSSSLHSVLRELVELELVEAVEVEVWRESDAHLRLEDTVHALTREQGEVVARLREALEARRFSSHLLQGVTGSGKTEVYLQAVADVLALGRGAIVLVPEIALTPQLSGRFRARFGDQVACLHSGLRAGERFDAWRRLLSGEVRIAVGARSALFAPVQSLGLIIVDEEHDASFKQDGGLKYNARDLALVRGSMEQAVVLLGSATPSLETLSNARRGKYQHHRLTARVSQRPMPRVTVVDMSLPANRPRVEESPLSPVLEDALIRTVGQGDQVILLLNRRGFAPFVLCPGCGGSFRCLNCEIGLTWHKRRGLMLCHYCGMGKRLPEHCPHCGHAPLELHGTGTERVEEFLGQLLPDCAIGRLDRDALQSRDGHVRILEAFRKGEQQVLVGTQMVVKGHDFPNVTLVGILSADYGLNLPDFRASERTFQLVTQVAGRAGRGERPGEVIVQTYAPQHPAVTLAARHDVDGFFQHESKLRRLHRYPPFFRLALVQISAQQEAEAEKAARTVAQALLAHVREGGSRGGGLEVIGPAPAPLSRLQRWFRWHVVLRALAPSVLHAGLSLVESLPLYASGASDIRITLDMDPMQML